MPTVVDSLVVTLGLDPANFTKGQKEAADALLKTQKQANTTAKEMQGDGAKAAQFFSGIKTEALSLIGVLLGGKGIEAFARDQTKSLADLGRSAKNIGIAVPVLAAFRNAVERNGGSAEAATASFQSLTDQMEHLKVYGNSPLMPFLNLIGGVRGDDPAAVFAKFTKFAQDHANDVPLINLVGKGLGLDQGSINFAMLGVSKVATELGRSYELGVPTKEMTDRVTAMQNAMIGLEQAATGAGNHLLSDAAPGIAAVATALADWIAKNPHEAETIGAISTALTVLGAVRVSANLMGLTGLAAALGSISLALATIVALGYGPDMGQNEYVDSYEKAVADGPAAVEEWEKRHPSLGRDAERWWQKNMPTWLGGGGESPGAALKPDIEQEVRRQASLHSLDADHMVRLAQKEQGGYDKVSPAGAFGPMQLMPNTAADVGVHQGGPWQDNVRGGMDYYARLLKQFNGNYAAADAAYNAGPNNPGVKRFADTGDASGLPDETRRYVNGINGTPNGVPRTGPTFGLRPPAVPLPPKLPPPTAAPAGTADGKNMTIGSVTIHTQATDAKGIARDFKTAMVTQANRGAA